MTSAPPSAFRTRLGTATEMRAMKNYAGHRLSPWLGHLMVSRQETARPLLTPGEVMQLPSEDELVLVSGVPPIRAKKARYFRGYQADGARACRRRSRDSDRKRYAAVGRLEPIASSRRNAGREVSSSGEARIDDPANGGIRREPELPEHEEIVPEPAKPTPEFAFAEEEPDDDAVRARALRQQARGLARQAAMDPGDGMDL